MALVILGFIGLGVSQNLILTRGFAETSVREVTANAVASGYIEQLKSMEYEKLVASIRNPDIPVPTVLSHGDPDPLFLGVTAVKTIVIDEDPDSGRQRTMELEVLLNMEDLVASGNGRLLSIELQYGWKDAKVQRVNRGILRTMRSYVPNF